MRIILRAVLGALTVGLLLATAGSIMAQECQNCKLGGATGRPAGGTYAPLPHLNPISPFAQQCHDGNCVYRQYGNPDLFYNYYTQDNCNSAPAKLYVSPLPVPAYVGHTYITYQPLMPHEMMYQHNRNYHRYYDNGQGFSRTSVRYR